MTMYLLKSGVCLLVLLIFHQLILEKETIHRFNRFYLLSSLVFSLLVPFVSFSVEPTAPVAPVQQIWQGVETALAPAEPHLRVSMPIVNFWSVAYWLITGTLLGRFGWNLYTLVRKINRSSTVPVDGATLVLLPENMLPYTFLQYLFVSKQAYETGAIERELYAHERAHIRQRHSLDILLIETVSCFLWFSPLLLWLKRAVRLNHEFLADGAVTRHYIDIANYQQVLFSKLTPQSPISLTSNISFQTTKKRFAMMTKHTSDARKWGLISITLLLLTTLLVAVSTQVMAQLTPKLTPAKARAVPVPKEQTSVAEMERLYGDKLVSVPITPYAPKSAGWKKFSELSEAQKEKVILIPPFPRKTPTEVEFKTWKNPKKYGVWVNDKRTRSFPSTSLKAGDIVSYSSSYVHKNARQPEGYLYQLNLMTKEYYQNYLKEKEAAPFLVLRER